jgi:hypothetical protein
VFQGRILLRRKFYSKPAVGALLTVQIASQGAPETGNDKQIAGFLPA